MAEIIGAHVKLQSAATSGTGNAQVLEGKGRECTVYIRGTGTIAGGAVQVEEAHDPNYSGTWAAVGSAQTVVDATVKAVHLTGCVGAVRARISTNITGGGVVDVDLFVN